MDCLQVYFFFFFFNMKLSVSLCTVIQDGKIRIESGEYKREGTSSTTSTCSMFLYWRWKNKTKMAGAVIGYEIFSPPAGIEENDPLLFNSPSSDEMIGSRHTVVLFF